MARGVGHPCDLPLSSSSGKPPPTMHLSLTNSYTRDQLLTIPQRYSWCQIRMPIANKGDQ